jgi:AcrR family transcriptional regulator
MAKIRSNRRITKKEIIKEEAARLFHNRGYGAASMRDLAEILGVEAPSLYNHINSKEELLQEICFSIANEFTFQISLMESNDKLTALQKVESIIRFHIHMWVDKVNDVLVMTNEAKHLSEPYLSTFLNERRVYAKRFAAIVADGVKKGELRKINPHVVVMTVLNAVRGIEFWHRSRKTINAPDLEENMVTALLNGLKKN